MSTNTTAGLPSKEDIQAARARIKDAVHVTPLLQCASICQLVPSAPKELYFKCENFQKTGSFKIRGATNAVRKILEDTPHRRKFLTHSSGNHAQALALACREAGAEAHIVIPSNAPLVKALAVKGYGATLHPCVPTLPSREKKAAEVEKALGPFTFVHPFDNPLIIAGQGTLFLEVIEQLGLEEPGAVMPDAVIVPVGGGGLISGVSLAVKTFNRNIKVYGAEPLGADDASRSYEEGKMLPHRDGCPNTIADGLLTTMADRTFNGLKENVDGVLTVTESAIKDAFRMVLERMKIVIEPSAAVGVAALLHGFPELASAKKVVVVLCGGNVQLDLLSEKFLNPLDSSKSPLVATTPTTGGSKL